MMGYTFKADDVYGLASKLGSDVREKGNELFFRNCPYCGGGNGRDRDTFSVNLDNGTFHCFRSGCGKSGHFVEMARDFGYPLDFGDTRRREYRPLPQKPFEVREPAVKYLSSRGIGPEVTKRYRVTTCKDNPYILAFPFYDENHVLQFLKYRRTDFDRTRDKNKEWCEKDTKPILFGMDQCEGFQRLVITEGQIDSLSVTQAGIPNAVSVPNGCNGFTFLENVWDWIVKFEEVVVFGDCEGGKVTLLDTLQKRLPNRVKAVRIEDYLGEKDANDILRTYGPDAIRKAVDNAKVPPVSHVKELADVKAVDIYKLPRIWTGIPELDKVIGGLFFGQVTLLTGKRGEGKSTFMSQLMVEALDQGYAAFAYSGELSDYHFKRWLDFQAAGPDNIATNTNAFGDETYLITNPVVEKINAWYRGRAYIYDNGAVDMEDELEGLLETMENVVRRVGVKLVCIDNLMTAMDVGVSDNLYQAQSAFVHKLKRLAVKYDIAVVLVAHPRKSKDSFTNDDVSGSGDITNRVDTVLAYSRNASKNEEDLEDCDSHLAVTKNRMFGKLTKTKEPIELYYSQKSKRITSKSGFVDGPKRYGWEQVPTLYTDFEEL